MNGNCVRRMTKAMLFLVGSILCFVSFEKSLAFAKETTVMVSDNDTKIIPDLYNTGPEEPEGGFTVITDSKLPCLINGEESILDGASTNNRFVLNLKYKHSYLNGEIVIENADLSDYTFTVYSVDALKEGGRNISFVFNNCKLRGFAGGRSSFDEISFEFNNCSFLSASGSDVTFNHCRFGGGISDRLNLFVNCHVNDCYIYNPTSDFASEGEIHVDGIQIYGNNTDSTVKAENIHFDNCRFEMPSLRYANAPKAYVNACIMLQTEFSDGDNMSFENCYVNGGGFSVYAHGAKGTKLSNIVFRNLHFGCTALYGRLYPDKPEQDQVEWNEDTWDDATSIYVGTVKRNQAKNKTYLCVGNDTNQKRYFRAYTSNGNFYDYSIDACPTYKEFNGSGMVFEDFPFDRLYTIPEYCDWVVVYEMLPTENSTAATMNQVRFQNWTENNSVTVKDISASTLEYELSETGTLTISGFGNMPEFSSVESIPWYSDRDKIKKVVITGVTSVSNNAFSDCVNLEEVVFPEQFECIGDSAFSGCIKLQEMKLNQAKALKSIGKNAFFNCIRLSKVAFPESIVSVGENAFAVDSDTYQEIRERTDVYYDGSIEKWLKISFGNSKSTSVSDATSNPMYLSGGNLYVNGSNLVTELNTQESSSTVIGRNVFAGCLSLTKVNLTGVTDIGANAFAKSKVGGEIVIPATVKRFGTYAFCECSSVEKLIWEASVTVAMGAFQSDTSLKEIVISGNATGVGNWAFQGCSDLEKVTLPDTMKTLAQQAFQNCKSLKDINIPEGVTSMGNYTFSGCTSLEKIALPDSVNSFGLSVFAGCTNLKEIRLSSSLSDLGTSCFNRCTSLETLELPETLTSISSSAFNECSSLKNIQIPASVKEIKSRAFYKCTALLAITFMGETCPTIASDAFNYVKSESVLVYIPEKATGYTDNASLVKIASHLFNSKKIAADSSELPDKIQYTCLLHENCEKNYWEETTQEQEKDKETVATTEKETAETTEKETEVTTEQETSETTEKETEVTTEQETSETTEKETEVTTEQEAAVTTEKETEVTTEQEAAVTTEKETEITTEQETAETTEKETEVMTEQETSATTEKETPTTTNKISVKDTVIKKVVNKKKKKIEVTWKKRKGVTGYEIQYCTNKNFKKGVRMKNVIGDSKGKVTIKGIKKNKRYYIRIRAYKKVEGKKYVSKWSKKKSVIILQ